MGQAQAILFFVSVLLFVIIFYWPWQRLCVAWSRQLMFEERDKLFLIAKSSESIPHDSELHRELRTLIDNIIRFCHKITWQRLLLNRKMDKSPASRRAARVSQLIDQIQDKSVRHELRGIVVRMAFACIVCMMGRSILLGPVFLVLYLVRNLRDSRDSETTQQVFRAVQIGAEREQSELVAIRAHNPASARVRA